MSGPSKNCVTLRTPVATIWSEPLVPENVQKAIAGDPARFIRAAAARPLKIGREALVLQTELPLDNGPLAVVIKRYNPRSLWKVLAALCRPTKAAQNWAKAEFLRTHGVATPRPLLACRAKGWRSLGSSFLVSEWIGGSENLHLFGWRIGSQSADVRQRMAAACAEQLGRLVGRMHAAGAVHRDLKAANFLVAEGSSGLETWLVDLDGLFIGGYLPAALRRKAKIVRRIDRGTRAAGRRQARDLARLAAGLAAHPWVTRSICLRFLRAYERQFPQGTIVWKPLWRAVAERTAEIVRRKQSRGERVL